jgi:hypothetical protein
MSKPNKQELIDTLQSEWERTAALFQSLPPEAWSLVIYDNPQVWTTRHILIHLCDAEHQFRRMLLNSLEGGEGSPVGVDYDTHNLEAVPRLSAKWATESNAELITRLAGVRASLIEAVAQFPEADLDRIIRHPLLGEIPVTEFIRAVFLHTKLHGRDIKRRLTA